MSSDSLLPADGVDDAPAPPLGIAHDLEPETLRRALLAGLACCTEGRVALDALRVRKARRSSSLRRNPHPLTLWIEAEAREPASGRVGVQWFYGKTFRDGAAADALPAALALSRAQPQFGDPVAHVADLDMLLWAWPNDPGLPQLAHLIDHDRAPLHLPRDPQHGTVTVFAHEVLRYEPERRASLRYGLRMPDGTPRVVYGKTFADDRAATLHERFEHFWHAAAADPEAPLVAEPLGVDPASRTLWQAAAWGVPLMERARADDAERDFAAVGRALARVHRAPLATSSERPIAHWLTEIERRRRKIARVAPELAERAGRIAERLVAAAAQLPFRLPRLLHGDFHPEQVWMDGARVVLFDFDEFCHGHPMEDLGAFIVKLEQTPLPSSRVRRLADALVDGYRSVAPTHWCPLALAWFRALQTLLQTSRAFIFQGPGWRHELAARLARTEACVAELR